MRLSGDAPRSKPSAMRCKRARIRRPGLVADSITCFGGRTWRNQSGPEVLLSDGPYVLHCRSARQDVPASTVVAQSVRGVTDFLVKFKAHSEGEESHLLL